MDDTDETRWKNRGVIVEKLMQLFVYYPLELEPAYAGIKLELEALFKNAFESSSERNSRPLYDPRAKYLEPDIAHPHMQPPYYTAMGTYLGLAYLVYSGLNKPVHGTAEYLPVNREQMMSVDPGMVSFLEKYMFVNSFTG
jgi:hypothetical protein